jgi:hypothetical protein
MKLEGFRHYPPRSVVCSKLEREIRDRLVFLRFGGVCEPEARQGIAPALSLLCVKSRREEEGEEEGRREEGRREKEEQESTTGEQQQGRDTR